VLQRPEYDWAHLPDAVHLPLKELTADRAAVLDRALPVVVYCNNTECDLSPRAAARLRRLGLGRVYDYVVGKMDWLSHGLPYHGQALLAGQVIHQDVPACHLDDRIAGIRRAGLAHADLCVVVDDDRVVHGVLDHEALQHGEPDITAEHAMTAGPTTVRPSEQVEALTERMCRAGVVTILVTRSDGRLLGLLVRADAEKADRSARAMTEERGPAARPRSARPGHPGALVPGIG
jgi:rhodanese-related sulfurtransferase